MRKGLEPPPDYKPTKRDILAFKKFKDARAKRAPRLEVLKINDVQEIVPKHPSSVIGEILLMEALGTTNQAFFWGLITQLAYADGGEIDEQKLNFLVSVVEEIKPRDHVEAMLAAQMACVHTATMKFARNLAEAKHLDLRDSAERTFNKLTRTFVTQMDALKRYRSSGQQTVTVQHVNVSEGGQAIVGNVTRGPDIATNRTVSPTFALVHDQKLPMPIMESKHATPVPPPRNSKKK